MTPINMPPVLDVDLQRPEWAFLREAEPLSDSKIERILRNCQTSKSLARLDPEGEVIGFVDGDYEWVVAGSNGVPHTGMPDYSDVFADNLGLRLIGPDEPLIPGGNMPESMVAPLNRMYSVLAGLMEGSEPLKEKPAKSQVNPDYIGTSSTTLPIGTFGDQSFFFRHGDRIEIARLRVPGDISAGNGLGAATYIRCTPQKQDTPVEH